MNLEVSSSEIAARARVNAVTEALDALGFVLHVQRSTISGDEWFAADPKDGGATGPLFATIGDVEQFIADETANRAAALTPQPGKFREALLHGTPSVGRIVHYVSYGTPGGEYGKECRAAIITEVPALLSEQPNDGTTAGLCVLNPTGQFFNRAVPYDGGTCKTLPHQDATRTALGDPVLCGGQCYEGGTWHWPERTS